MDMFNPWFYFLVIPAKAGMPAPAPLQAKLRLQPVVQAKKIGESTLSPIL